MAQSDAEMHERDAVIWDLKVKGKSLRQIAEVVGLSHQGVANSIERGYKRVIVPKVEDARAMDLERLDRLLDVLEPQLLAADEKVIASYIKVLDRRAKLLGLDAPTKVSATVHEVTQQDLELAEIINEAKAKNEAARASLDQAP